MATRITKAACGLGLTAFGGVLYYTYKQTLIGKLKETMPELQNDK